VISQLWRVSKAAVLAFIADEALSRGAAIAFYTVTSIAPILLIIVAMAGMVFGRDAAQQAITAQLAGLMGQQTAQMLQDAVANASDMSSGILATIIGVATLLATASGTFGEIQAALNTIWKAKPKEGTISRLIRARAASAGLVATLGFLLVVSLAASAVLTALGEKLNAAFPFGALVMSVLNVLISFVLISLLFAAVYKVLPDRHLQWRDVITGAMVTALLFLAGKSLIGWYIGSSAVASIYGAAGALMVLLLWVYYSVQIFLFGAEFTKCFANRHGSKEAKPVAEKPNTNDGRQQRS
jgi:membrane protein